MGPEFWAVNKGSKLQKCSERVSNSCTDETDGCCAVIPCAYCLIWDPYSYEPEYGFAEFGTREWIGTIAGVTWRAYWQRNYITEECEFIVELDNREIYRGTCYDSSCRDSSGSVNTTIGGIDGQLQWIKYEPRPLEYRQDEDTKCTVHFCDDCECTCECMCATVFNADSVVLAQGEICDTAYDCDGPLWSGVLGDYTISVALGHDIYDRCVITATVNGTEYEPVLAPGCTEIAAEISLNDGKRLVVTCKRCDCDEDCPCPCCPDCWRRVGASVGGVLQAIAGPGGQDCGVIEGSGEEFAQEIDFRCIDDTGEGNDWPVIAAISALRVRVFCDGNVWKAQYKSEVVGPDWVDTGVTFSCPACEGIESGGLVTSTFTFDVVDGCETSGGPVTFTWTITITLTVECL